MKHTLALVLPVRSGCFRLPARLAQLLVLYCDELYRVSAYYHLLRITAGIAYVTQAGQDHILVGGQELRLDSTADMALVSGIGGEPVILELFDHAKPCGFYDTAAMDNPNFAAHRRGGVSTYVGHTNSVV
jgi:hypothetical protein